MGSRTYRNLYLTREEEGLTSVSFKTTYLFRQAVETLIWKHKASLGIPIHIILSYLSKVDYHDTQMVYPFTGLTKYHDHHDNEIDLEKRLFPLTSWLPKKPRKIHPPSTIPRGKKRRSEAANNKVTMAPLRLSSVTHPNTNPPTMNFHTGNPLQVHLRTGLEIQLYQGSNYKSNMIM